MLAYTASFSSSVLALLHSILYRRIIIGIIFRSHFVTSLQTTISLSLADRQRPPSAMEPNSKRRKIAEIAVKQSFDVLKDEGQTIDNSDGGISAESTDC